MEAHGGAEDRPRNGLVWRVERIEKQLDEYDPAVQAALLNRLADEVKWMRRALWGVVFSVMTAVIVYLLTIRLGVRTK